MLTLGMDMTVAMSDEDEARMSCAIEMIASNATIQDSRCAWEAVKAHKNELRHLSSLSHSQAPGSQQELPYDFDTRYTSLRKCLASMGFRLGGNAWRLSIQDYYAEDGHGSTLSDYALFFKVIAKYVHPTDDWRKPCIIWKDEHHRVWCWTFEHGYAYDRLVSEELDPQEWIPMSR